MKISAHAVWLVGFRPFFILATLAGALLPILWALIFSGSIATPNTSLTIIQWHAHEMFFGFGLAVLGGFLLTATKNWVHIRGYNGNSLILLVIAWVLERVVISFGEHLPPILFILFSNLFLSLLILMVIWTLTYHRHKDSLKENIFFILILPFFIVSKNLILHSEYFILGSTMTLGLFRMAFLIMLERTVTQFMKTAFQVNLLKNKLLDNSIKILSFLLVFETLLPSGMLSLISLSLVLLLGYRFIFWKPQLALKRLDIGIMYLGYLAILLQLILILLNQFLPAHWIGAVSVHIFTFGAMGFIIPAMIIRISKGHTGRSVTFDTTDKITIWIMITAFIFRIFVTQIYPSLYLTWISFAALCWFSSFIVLFIRYTPILLQPRIDGKEH